MRSARQNRAWFAHAGTRSRWLQERHLDIGFDLDRHLTNCLSDAIQCKTDKRYRQLSVRFSLCVSQFPHKRLVTFVHAFEAPFG